jgi:hypothetical protein
MAGAQILFFFLWCVLVMACASVGSVLEYVLLRMGLRYGHRTSTGFCCCDQLD